MTSVSPSDENTTISQSKLERSRPQAIPETPTQWTGLAFLDRSAEWLVLHLIVTNAAGSRMHRSGWRRNKQRGHATDRTIRRVSLGQKVGWRQPALRLWEGR